MNHLYELGKRIERLLYTSVVVIVASLLIYSLSNSIIISSATNKYQIYQGVRASLFKEKENIERTKSILSAYEKYKSSEIERKNEYEKSISLINNKAEEEKNNKIRKKLGLSTNHPIVDKAYTPLDYYSYDKDLEEINEITHRSSINRYVSLDAAHGADTTIIRALINDVITKNLEVYKELNSIIDTKDSVENIINILDKNIDIFKNDKLKIFDIETPLNVPFSIGDMKSSISLYNIEQWSMIVMPIFLVIWFGSIVITRRIETYLILEEKIIMNAYPHVLNIFSILDKKNQSKKTRTLIERSLLGDDKSINEIKSYGYTAFFMRTSILVGMFILMAAPAYYGFYTVILNDLDGSNLLRLICITLGVCINIIQLICIIEIESRFLNKTFILGGVNNEII